MNKRRATHRIVYGIFFTLVAGIACGPAPEQGTEAASSAPNVVVIVADDAGYSDFGAFGDPEMATPAIDSIAANGIRFTQGYNAASVCSPSRAGLLTGRYPQRFGHEFNIPRTPQPGADIEDIGLPLAEVTIADTMRDVGYATIAVGKWHLGISQHFFPMRRGFDQFFGFLYGSRSYFPIEGINERGLRLWRDHEVYPEGGYMTDLLAEKAATLIEVNRQSPFFMYVSFNAVHTPMDAKPEHLALFEDIDDERRQALAAMTVALDEAVGTILAKLREHDLEENTLLFFVNDNGGATNNASINDPLRGQKGDKFEGGIRVPFMVQWPARLPRGADFDAPVSSLDILPTAMAATGRLDRPTGRGRTEQPLDGVNLLPYITGETTGRPHETLFWRRGVIAAVREGDWKLIRVDGTPAWLFDLAADPYETTNLLEAEPERAGEMVASLAAWEANTVEPRWRTDPFWTQNQIDKHTEGTAAQPVVGVGQEGYTPTAASAPSTDIYVGALSLGDEAAAVTEVENVTDRDGYDNQPAFGPDGTTLLYTSARNAHQTDIYRYDLSAETTRQVTQTTASEFSATPLPSGDGFSSIHEAAGAQHLWRFGADGTSRGGILENVQPVGYHAWGDDDTLIMFVLGGDGTPATLQLGRLSSGTAEVLAENPGRSLHKVPGRHAVSFVRKIDRATNWWIEVLDLDSGETTRVAQTLPGREDYAWTPDGRIVMGDGSKLFMTRAGEEWVEIADLEAVGVSGITRLAINEDGTRIAIVGNRD